MCALDQPDLFLIDGIFVFAHVFGLRPVKLHLACAANSAINFREEFWVALMTSIISIKVLTNWDSGALKIK